MAKLQPEPMAGSSLERRYGTFDKLRKTAQQSMYFPGQSSSRQKNGMILRNWTRSLKCWEKTIKTLSLQLQPRQCRPGCFGNIRRWQGRTMREGTTSLDRGKMHAQIALFTRDTRQNWLKKLAKGMDIWTVWCAGT